MHSDRTPGSDRNFRRVKRRIAGLPRGGVQSARLPRKLVFNCTVKWQGLTLRPLGRAGRSHPGRRPATALRLFRLRWLRPYINCTVIYTIRTPGSSRNFRRVERRNAGLPRGRRPARSPTRKLILNRQFKKYFRLLTWYRSAGKGCRSGNSHSRRIFRFLFCSFKKEGAPPA